MLSNSCKYGIRAVIYIASQNRESEKTGIKQISSDLGLPTPFLAKILQQLTKHKILISLKGPHGGFSVHKDPKKITLFDIIRIIDGEGIFNDCIIHNTHCDYPGKSKYSCPLHDEYSVIRSGFITMCRNTTIYDLVNKSRNTEKIHI
jgi:Rrf2 family iron-sulfur cluster assembly transcriptional regulator